MHTKSRYIASFGPASVFITISAADWIRTCSRNRHWQNGWRICPWHTEAQKDEVKCVKLKFVFRACYLDIITEGDRAIGRLGNNAYF